MIRTAFKNRIDVFLQGEWANYVHSKRALLVLELKNKK